MSNFERMLRGLPPLPEDELDEPDTPAAAAPHASTAAQTRAAVTAFWAALGLPVPPEDDEPAEPTRSGHPRPVSGGSTLVLDFTRVRAARREAGLTIAELAERSGVGARTIGRIETGRVIPNVGTLSAIAGGLGITDAAELATLWTARLIR